MAFIICLGHFNTLDSIATSFTWTIGFGTLDLFSSYCASEYHAKIMNRDLKEQKVKPKKKAHADEPLCYYLICSPMCLI